MNDRRRRASRTRPPIFGLVAPRLLASPLPCHAQNLSLRFDRLNVEDGLSNNWVQSIIKDNRGFLWFGTQDGLNRYDGGSIRIYLPRIGAASPIKPRQVYRQEGLS